MIIDSHTHIDLFETFGWMDPPEALLPLLDNAGISKAVVMTYRDAISPDDPAIAYVLDAVNRYPDRLIGYARINPNAEKAVQTLDYAMHFDAFMGLKLHPVTYVGLPYTETALRLINRAAEYNAPVLFHSGDEQMALPHEIIEAARMCPNAMIIMGHMGGYFHVEAAIRLAKELPNVLFDTSAMPYPHMIRRAVEALGVERILFASDGPGCLPALEVEKVHLAGLSPEDEDLVFSGNFLRLMKEVRHEL